MSQINPFAGSILQTPLVQKQQSSDKDRQVRRAREAEKNTALAGDTLEHQVESSEELKPTEEHQKRERRFKRPKHHAPAVKPDEDDDQSHLDLTA